MTKIKRYINSEGQVTTRPKSIYLNGWTYTPPTDEVLVANGWTIEYVEQAPLSLPTNATIRLCRQQAYTNRADKYFIAYQAYMELGEAEKAEECKKQWLEERAKIDKQYPYREESDEVTTEEATEIESTEEQVESVEETGVSEDTEENTTEQTESVETEQTETTEDTTDDIVEDIIEENTITEDPVTTD